MAKQTVQPAAADLEIGCRVKITGKHCWAGCAGELQTLDERVGPLGFIMCRVQLDDAHAGSCYAGRENLLRLAK